MLRFLNAINRIPSLPKSTLKIDFPLAFVALVLLPLIAGAQQRPKIVVANLSDDQFSELQASALVDFIPVSDSDEAIKEIADADALLGLCNLDLIQAGKQLKWIQIYSAGVDRFRFPELRDSVQHI